MRVPLTHLYPRETARRVQPEAVASLADSMNRLGLLSPIGVRRTVRIRDGRETDAWEVVFGNHRLEAARRLGWTEMEAWEITGNELDARLREIAENLHRAELTVLERDEQLAEWIKLTEEKVRQVGAPAGGKQPNNRGIRAASREHGVSEQDARRAEKVASLSPEAKQVARDHRLDNNREAMIEAAKLPPAEQAAALRTKAESRTQRAPRRSPVNALEAEDAWRDAVFKVWNRGSAEWRERILDELSGGPVFSRTKAGRAA